MRADNAVVPPTTDPRLAPGGAPARHPLTPATTSPSATPLLELVGSATELTFLVDGSLRIVYAGGALQTLLGFDPSEVVGRPVVEFVHPSHQQPLASALAQVRDGAAIGEATLRWASRHGGPGLDLGTSFPPLGAADGHAGGLMIRARHLPSAAAAAAALEGNDNELWNLAPSLPLAVFMLDERGRCGFMSPRWTTLSGMPDHASLGLGWLGAMVEEDREGFRVEAAQAHARRTGWRMQFRIRNSAGAVLWIDAAASPRFAPDGSVSGYVGMLADATAEIQARAELNRRTTIVESTAAYVVMDDRGPRLSYTDEATTPLAATPPVPASDAAATTRPSLGSIPNEAQARYINEIRPAVLAEGVWQDRPHPAAPAPNPVASATPAAPDATAAAAPHATAAADPHATAAAAPAAAPAARPADTPGDQPVAWDFRGAPASSPAPARPGRAVDSAPLGGSEQVFVGLVGPSGRVETVAAVTDSVLEPVPWETVGDQLPTIDPITGLANRALFLERIAHALARTAREGVSLALMLPTLHGYGELRHRVGHKTGDDQLFVMAKRLEATIRQTDTVARIGDEDFAILAMGWFFPGDVENVGMRFVRKLSEPVPSIGVQVVVPASMGIAVSEPGLDVHQLLRRAQRARKTAAELGPGHVSVYRSE